MLACGGAVVTSDDPAIQEVTQGRCWTVPARDAQAWRDVIRQILSTPSCLDRYRGHTAFVAREYTWSRTAERMRDVYRRACGT
jgi:glycosyltransferase involved in cell wall biosynthesis